MEVKKAKKKKLFSVLRIVILSAAAVVLGVNVYLWNARTLVGNSLPMPFGFGAAVVLSGSMEPTLKVDDLILIREQETYQVGDIVVFQDGGSLTVHRLLSYDSENAITKGDANNVADEPIGSDQIMGAVFARIPMMGVVVSAIKTPIGILLTLGGALLLAEISYRSDRKEGDEKLELLKEEIRKLRQEQEAEDGAQNETDE